MTMKPVMRMQMWHLAPLDRSARVGVLLYDAATETDALLSQAVNMMRAKTLRPAGLLQHFGERLANGKRSMWLEDIESRLTMRLDKKPGPDIGSVMLDADALMRGGALLQRAAASGADVIFVNRFGNAEADGGGMRTQIAAAIGSGSAVVIPVRFSLLNDLEGFLGGPAFPLLPSPVAIVQWAEYVAAQSQTIN